MRAVNLIPPEERARSGIGAGRAGGGVYAVFVLLGGLAVMVLLYGLAAHRISSRRALLAALNAHAQQAETRVAALASYTSFAAMREQRAQTVAALASSRFDWAHALHELARVLPPDVSLTSLDGQIGPSGGGPGSGARAPTGGASSSSSSSSTGGASSSPVSSATPPGSVPTFTLTGCATSQAQVAVTLDRLHLIDGVDEVTLQSSTKSGSTGAGGGGGGCEANGVASFDATVTFDALPDVPAGASDATRALADTGGAAPSTGASP